MEAHELGLLVAITLPVVVIVVINVLLAIGGERGTLLLPSLAPYPTVTVDTSLEQPQSAEAVEPAAVVAQPVAPAARRPRGERIEADEELVAQEAA